MFTFATFMPKTQGDDKWIPEIFAWLNDLC